MGKYSFNQWLKSINQNDNVFLLQLRIYLEDRAYDEAIDLIKQLRAETIVLLAYADPNIDAFLEHKDLKPHFITKLQQANPAFKCYHPFTPYQLFKGALLCQIALRARVINDKKYSPDELSFYYAALKLDVYIALERLVNYNLTRMDDLSNVGIAISLSLIAARKHASAGFILLAETYLRLSAHYNDDQYHRLACIALKVAEKLSHLSNSDNALMSIYGEQGLAGNNSLDANTWEKAIQKILSLRRISIPVLNDIYHQANLIYQDQLALQDETDDSPTP